jgi:hypothetical protein
MERVEIAHGIGPQDQALTVEHERSGA